MTDIELEQLLIETLGMPHLESKLIILLAEKKELSSRDIATMLDVQQPVVSRITGKLVDKDILVKHSESNEGRRGRRAYLYTLAASPVAILNKFLKPKIDQMREQERAVQQSLLRIRKK